MVQHDQSELVLDEPILPDDFPVHQGFLYVANGKVVEFIDGENMTVGRWKALSIPGVPKVTEVRSCDLTTRQLRAQTSRQLDVTQVASRRALDVTPTISTSDLKALVSVSGKPKQKHRKPRCSNKIKKVK